MTGRAGYKSLPPLPTDARVSRVTTDGDRLLAFTEGGVYAWDKAAGTWAITADPGDAPVATEPLRYSAKLSWGPVARAVGLTDDPYRTPSRPVPPRTVFVNPVVFYAIARRYVGGLGDPMIHVECSMVDGIKVKTGPGDDSWSIAPDPDCPTDYAWPEEAPTDVAAVVRAGIDDAKQGPHVVPDRPLVRIRHEDGTEDVAELHLTHPPRVGKATIE